MIESVLQHDSVDCGPACMAMILKYYKSDISLYSIKEELDISNSGMSVFEMVNAFKKYECDCEAFQVDKQFWNEKVEFPIIVHLVQESSRGHFVVVYKVSKKYFHILDPAYGKIKVFKEIFFQEWSGVVLFTSPNENYQPTAEKQHYKLKLPFVFRNELKVIIAIILSSLFIILFGIASTFYFQIVIDKFLLPKNVKMLDILSISLIIAYIFSILLEFIKNYMYLTLRQRLSSDVMLSYLKHVLLMPLNFYGKARTGDIISRFTDATFIVDAFSNFIISMFIDFGMIIVVGTTLCVQNKILFLLTAVSLPIYCYIIYSFSKKYDKENSEEMATRALVNSMLVESLNGIETIKALGFQQIVLKRIEKKFFNMQEKYFRVMITGDIQQRLQRVVQSVSSILILWIGSYYVMDGKISLGSLITYNALLNFFTGSVQNIFTLQVKLRTAKTASSRLADITNKQIEDIEPCSSHTLSYEPNYGITITEVSYSYGKGAPVISNISLSLNKNSKLAIVGKSGSGKSTLAKLLVKFYKPNNGNISNGNIDFINIPTKTLREKIVYLPQESYFFSGTILENLFGDADYRMDELKRICKAVGILTVIEEMPNKFESVLEENASNFSAGQKQRLAIVRAMLKKPSVIILDESTSNLDTLSETLIIHYLMELSETMVLFITHHLELASQCTSIIVLDNGEICEQGTHKQLVEKEGTYYSLWQGRLPM